ncbi:hypothetical protein [Psychroflexus maritimus]|uniref:RHS repeat-associated core domain-containing protein n=1 Tax=Psychroflexus maritimus TaxID=2714865 RepID=A0A967E363_9FLAO|nr:hypothetical protein [Psychroflexus maritimus]NGZ90394.1 hypothetical protein [Psychroflexus maritimus]
MDPLAEKYPSISSYAYVANNPLRYIDPDGMRIDDSYIYETNDDETFKNPELVEAFEFFAGTKEGKEFLSKYAEKGQTIGGVTFDQDGEFHEQGINLNFEGLPDNDNADGRTGIKITGEGLDITIKLGITNVDDYIELIGHEGFLHADKYSVDYSDDKEINFSKGIDKDIVKYVESSTNSNKRRERYNHHFQERRDKVLEKKSVPILHKYYEKSGVIKTLEELKHMVNSFQN